MNAHNNNANSLYIFRGSKPTIESIRCHLKLGTIRFKFYDLQAKKLVDEINITKPFILKAQAWNGEFKKDGGYSFVNNNELSKICFREILDNGFYDYVRRFRPNPFSNEPAVKKANRLCKKFGLNDEYKFLVKELKHYYKDRFDWNIPDSVVCYYFDDEPLKAKQLLKKQLAEKGKYIKQFSVQEIAEHKASHFRSGMSYRYKKLHGKDFALGAYFLDYLHCFEGWFVDGHVITADNVKSKYIEGIRVPGGLGSHPETDVEMANSLVLIHNNWSAVALLSDEQKMSSDIVNQIFNFNPETPANLFPDFFNDKAHVLKFIDKPGIDIKTFHKYFNNKEIALQAMQIDAIKTYPMLNKDLKSDPDILKYATHWCIKYFPCKLKKDKDFLIKFGIANHSEQLTILHAHKSIRSDLDFLMSVIGYSHEEPFIYDKVIFSKELLDELKEIGATIRIKDEKVELTPSVIECFKELDIDNLHHIENSPKDENRVNNMRIIWNLDLSQEEIKLIVNSNTYKNRVIQNTDIWDLDIETIVKMGAIELAYSSTTIMFSYDDLKKVQAKRFAARLGSTLTVKVDKPKRMKV